MVAALLASQAEACLFAWTFVGQDGFLDHSVLSEISFYLSWRSFKGCSGLALN